MVGIEDVEDVVGEGGWVTEGEELFVDFLKFRFSEIAGGTVFEEAFVPLLELFLVEVCGFLEVGQLLLGELALTFAHGGRPCCGVAFPLALPLVRYY